MLYIVPALIGYLLGCSNMATYLAALRGVAAVTLISDYIVIGTMTTVVSVPLFSAWEHHYVTYSPGQ